MTPLKKKMPRSQESQVPAYALICDISQDISLTRFSFTYEEIRTKSGFSNPQGQELLLLHKNSKETPTIQIDKNTSSLVLLCGYLLGITN